jgi:hypothetical protein
MSQTTPLSSGTLNGQTITINLVEPGNDKPPAIIVKWPEKASVCPPATFDQLVASAMRVLSNAVVELAAIRVWKKKL